MTNKKIITTENRLFYQNNGAVDPVTLKDILKRSNGTSLSEILQQHNLSLADLLSGQESVISMLNSNKPHVTSTTKVTESEEYRKLNTQFSDYKGFNKPIMNSKEESLSLNLETKQDLRKFSPGSNVTTTQTDQMDSQEELKTGESPTFNITVPKIVARRRLPIDRKRLRMRPMMNNTYKSQLSRDLMTLNSKQQFKHLQSNSSKPAELNEFTLGANINNNNQIILNRNRNVTKHLREDVTTVSDIITGHFFDKSVPQASNDEVMKENMNKEAPIQAIANITVERTNLPIKVSLKYTDNSVVKRPVNSSTSRQQEFNIRLKRKKPKQKSTTTASPQNSILNLSGGSDLISSTENAVSSTTSLENALILKLQHGYTPTGISKVVDNVTKARLSSHSRTTSTTTSPISSTTEEFARIEIEEILNDIGSKYYNTI